MNFKKTLTIFLALLLISNNNFSGIPPQANAADAGKTMCDPTSTFFIASGILMLLGTVAVYQFGDIEDENSEIKATTDKTALNQYKAFEKAADSCASGETWYRAGEYALIAAALYFSIRAAANWTKEGYQCGALAAGLTTMAVITGHQAGDAKECENDNQRKKDQLLTSCKAEVDKCKGLDSYENCVDKCSKKYSDCKGKLSSSSSSAPCNTWPVGPQAGQCQPSSASSSGPTPGDVDTCFNEREGCKASCLKTQSRDTDMSSSTCQACKAVLEAAGETVKEDPTTSSGGNSSGRSSANSTLNALWNNISGNPTQLKYWEQLASDDNNYGGCKYSESMTSQMKATCATAAENYFKTQSSQKFKDKLKNNLAEAINKGNLKLPPGMTAAIGNPSTENIKSAMKEMSSMGMGLPSDMVSKFNEGNIKDAMKGMQKSTSAGSDEASASGAGGSKKATASGGGFDFGSFSGGSQNAANNGSAINLSEQLKTDSLDASGGINPSTSDSVFSMISKRYGSYTRQMIELKY